jgi:hypothetical protein
VRPEGLGTFKNSRHRVSNVISEYIEHYMFDTYLTNVSIAKYFFRNYVNLH